MPASDGRTAHGLSAWAHALGGAAVPQNGDADFCIRNGRLVNHGDVPLAWGGSVALCTRDGRLELADHKDCPTRGLNSAGFAVIDLAGKPSTTVRFKEP